MKSAAKVSRLRSNTSGAGEIVVDPCPRASRESIPADGRRFLISDVRTAKDRPEEPAPWWVTNNGPLPTGDVRYA